METKDKKDKQAHPGETLGQPVPADAIPTPVDTRHPGEKLEQPVPSDPIATPKAAPAPKLSVEHWAEKHKMLPEVFPGKTLQLPKAALGQRSVRVSMARSGEVAPKHNSKYVHFYAAKLHNNWVQGHEMTEAEFLAAVKKAYGPDAEVICR